MTGRAYAVAGGKGGVGKTTTVVNLGVMLRVAGHRVAVVDADLGMANVATVLGIGHEPTVHDVLAGDADTLEAVVEEPDGFGVVPGSTSLDGFASAEPEDLEQVIETLIADYDIVLVDTGAGLSFESVLPVGMTDGVLLVTTPDRAAVEDTAKTAEITDLAEGEILGAVLTRARDDVDLDIDGIADQLGMEVLEVIPEDPAVQASIDDQKPLITLDPQSPAATAYRSLGNALLEHVESGLETDQVEEDAQSDQTADPDPNPPEQDGHEPGPEDEPILDQERTPERGTEDEDSNGVAESEPAAAPPDDEAPDASPTAEFETDDLGAGSAQESDDSLTDEKEAVAAGGQPEPDQGDPLKDVETTGPDGSDPVDGPSSGDPAVEAGDEPLDLDADRDRDPDRSEADREQDQDRDGTDDGGSADADEPLGGLTEGSIGSSAREDVEDLLDTDDPADSVEDPPVGADRSGPTDEGAIPADRPADTEDETGPEEQIEPLDLDLETEPNPEDSPTDFEAEEASDGPAPSTDSMTDPVAAPETDEMDGESGKQGGQGEVTDDSDQGPESEADVDAVADAARGAAAVSDELDDVSFTERELERATETEAESKSASEPETATNSQAESHADSNAATVVEDDVDVDRVGSGEDGTESDDGVAEPQDEDEALDGVRHDEDVEDRGEAEDDADADDQAQGPSGAVAAEEAAPDDAVDDQPIGGSTEEANEGDEAEAGDDVASDSEGGISIPEAPSADDEPEEVDESAQQEADEETESGESRGFLSRLLNPFG